MWSDQMLTSAEQNAAFSNVPGNSRVKGNKKLRKELDSITFWYLYAHQTTHVSGAHPMSNLPHLVHMYAT